MELSILTFMMNEIHTIWKHIMRYPWLTLYLYDSVYMKRLCTHLKSWSYAMVSLCTPNQWDWLKHLWIRCSSNWIFLSIIQLTAYFESNSKNCNEIHNYTIFSVIKSKSMKRFNRFVAFILASTLKFWFYVSFLSYSLPSTSFCKHRLKVNHQC